MNNAGKAATNNKRWWLWLPLLAVGVWLALFGDKSPASEAALSLPTSAPAPRTSQGSAADEENKATPAPRAESPLALRPREQLFAKGEEGTAPDKPARRDLFSTRSWNPPPPPPPSPEPAAAPVAPPVPFTFLGKKLEGETWEVYLARGEQTFIAREGQVLEGDWRVDKIAPPSLSFIYLPLSQPQTLSIGDSR